MKRVVVQMSDECHKALKQYAAFYGLTMSEVLYHNTRVGFHKQSVGCNVVQDIFDKLGISQDKRTDKPCFGSLCHSCIHLTACGAGVYKGVIEMEERLLPFTKECFKRTLADMQEAHGQVPQFSLED
tara:strand:+ start:356 stop:736 length:381 start_codon:yes stop_codon:yes gene_type:complete